MTAVVVVNWNRCEDTLRCLSSLEWIAHEREVIVVDNGSTDESVIRFQRAFPNLTIIETGTNRGFAGGANEGIRQAMSLDAEFIWLLNNDTIVHPDCLAAMVRVAGSDPHIGAVGSVILERKDEATLQAWGGGSVNLWLGVAREFTRPVVEARLHYLTAASVLVRTAVFRDIGLLDDGFFMYWEDCDFGFRLRKAGWKLRVASDSLVRHERWGSSDSEESRERAYNASAVRFFQKHARMPFVPIVVGSVGRAAKRILHGEPRRARATMKSSVQALRRWHHSGPRTHL